MSSPFWNYPGVKSGRIAPLGAAPQGADEDHFYGFVSYTYSYAYDYYSGNVFCLGHDGGRSESFISVGAEASIEQVADLTGISIIYFTWRLVTSEDMPQPRQLQVGGPCELLDGGIINRGTGRGSPGILTQDGCRGIVLPADATSLLRQEESGRVVRITGSDHNDGDHSLRAVPWNQTVTDPITGNVGGITEAPNSYQRSNGQAGVFDDFTGPAEDLAAVSIDLLGARWVARGFVDGTLRTELTEKPGRSWQRNYMAMHVSKLSGDHTVTLKLMLELTEPD